MSEYASAYSDFFCVKGGGLDYGLSGICDWEFSAFYGADLTASIHIHLSRLMYVKNTG